MVQRPPVGQHRRERTHRGPNHASGAASSRRPGTVGVRSSEPCRAGFAQFGDRTRSGSSRTTASRPPPLQLAGDHQGPTSTGWNPMSADSADTACLACGSSRRSRPRQRSRPPPGPRGWRAWTWFQPLTTGARGSRRWTCSAVELPASASRSHFPYGNDTATTTTVWSSSPSWRSVSSWSGIPGHKQDHHLGTTAASARRSRRGPLRSPTLPDGPRLRPESPTVTSCLGERRREPPGHPARADDRDFHRFARPQHNPPQRTTLQSRSAIF
jgi:hypothetical protein